MNELWILQMSTQKYSALYPSVWNQFSDTLILWTLIIKKHEEFIPFQFTSCFNSTGGQQFCAVAVTSPVPDTAQQSCCRLPQKPLTVPQLLRPPLLPTAHRAVPAPMRWAPGCGTPLLWPASPALATATRVLHETRHAPISLGLRQPAVHSSTPKCSCLDGAGISCRY